MDFETDGSLRDIYVKDIDKSVWNALIASIREAEYIFKFFHGQSELNLPDSFCAIKNMQKTDPTTLKLWLPGNIQVNCHFFSDHQIELDVSPLEIHNEGSFKQLVSFLYWLAITTSSEVLLTHENSPSQVILSVRN